MGLPWHDWQFWVVTAVALGALWVLVRQVIPRSEGPACGGCASGAAACAKHRPPGGEAPGERLVTLGRD